MAKKLLFPEDARGQLRRRYERNHRKWLTSGGIWPLSISLGEPTERNVWGHTEHLRQWVSAWSAWVDGGVLWNEVHWPRLGAQLLPARLELASAEVVATLIGEGPRFMRARERRAELVKRWQTLEASPTVERYFDILAEYPQAEYRRLVELLSWLVEHPTSSHGVRELPVEGIDTKWIEKSRQTLVADLLQAIRGSEISGDFYDICGLRRPRHRVRLMVLSPELRTFTGGLRDIEAPLMDLEQLVLAPSRALIVENLESGLSLPDIPGAVAFIKLGASVGLLRSIPWLRGVECLYWGDIDSHGLVILNRARASLSNVRSVLMDESTLLAHRNLWGTESQPHADTELGNLTASELSLFRDLRSNRWGPSVRLEQERIPWSHAVDAVLDACRNTGSVRAEKGRGHLVQHEESSPQEHGTNDPDFVK